MNSTVFEMIIRVFGAFLSIYQFCGSPSGSAATLFFRLVL